MTTGFAKVLFIEMISIGLQKMFDTSDHQTLIKKLKCVGFSKKIGFWFKSFLSE